MCSVGDAFNIEITALNAKFYNAEIAGTSSEVSGKKYCAHPVTLAM